MSSVNGSRLAFFQGSTPINLVLTATGATDLNGNSLQGDTVSGAYNIEVFTSVAGGLAANYQGSAFIQGAVTVSGNGVQAGTISATEQILQGSYSLLDQFGAENIQVIGSGAGGDAITVTGSGGDTITGSLNAGNTQLIDASNTNIPAINPGPETITGGAGNTTVWAANGDSVTGGAGAITVAGNDANQMTITGGSGDLQTFNFGTLNSITGGTGTTFIDDNYPGPGGTANLGHNIIFGGAGSGSVVAPTGAVISGFGTYIVAGTDDRIFGGSGTALINAIPEAGSTIIGGTGSAEVWAGTGESVIGAVGNFFVAGDSGSNDTIQGGSTATTVVAGASDSVIDGHGSLLYSEGNSSSLTGGHGAIEAVNLGTGNTIGGATSSGANTFIDDSYTSFATGAFTGGGNTLTGGAGPSTVIAGPGDTISDGSGTLEAVFKSDLTGNATVQASDTVNLSPLSGRAAVGLRDLPTVIGSSTVVGAGTNVTVTGFSTTSDHIESPDSSATLIGSETTYGGAGGGTVVHFTDGSSMTLVGTTGLTALNFTH